MISTGYELTAVPAFMAHPKDGGVAAAPANDGAIKLTGRN